MPSNLANKRRTEMKILLIDNYDSFTYNIVHAVKQLGYEVDVVRNDKIALDAIDVYDKIIISPGPGIPSEAGIVPEMLKRYSATKSVLGVCLGHQAIGECFGAKLLNLPQVYHGIQTSVTVVKEDYLFEGMPATFRVGRYHSWVVDTEEIPAELEVLAVDDEQRIMALRHKTLDVRGVQFHPESILTPDGLTIINNWLKH
jgi:anthranilate synthase component 2